MSKNTGTKSTGELSIEPTSEGTLYFPGAENGLRVLIAQVDAPRRRIRVTRGDVEVLHATLQPFSQNSKYDLLVLEAANGNIGPRMLGALRSACLLTFRYVGRRDNGCFIIDETSAIRGQRALDLMDAKIGFSEEPKLPKWWKSAARGVHA